MHIALGSRGKAPGFREGILHIEYAGGRIKHNIVFIFSLFYEYSNLEYVHIHGIYWVIQAEYVSRMLVAASQEYVNT